jgi:hypothetical protein
VPAISTITAADAAATPVDHDFAPSRIDGDIARFLEKSASTPDGYMPLSVSLRAPKSGNGSSVYRCQISLAIPVTQTQTINGVDSDTVVRTGRVNVEFILPATGVLQERKDMRQLIVNILEDADVKDVIENLNNYY